MEPEARQRQSAVRLLSRRFPDFTDRGRLAERAGLTAAVQLTGDAERVWADLYDAAVERDRLRALLLSAHRLRPEDRALARLAGVPPEGPLVPVWAWVGLAAVALGATIYLLRGAGERPDPPAAPPPTGEAAPLPPEEEALIEELTAPAAAPAGEEAAAGGRAAPDAAPDPAEAEALADAAREAQVRDVEAREGPCQGEPGEIVGYFYAREALEPGRLHRLVGGVHVRAQYPNQKNRWNTRARVICVLPAGTGVIIRRAPIPVGEGHWWVPVEAGAVLGDAP